MIGRPVPIQVSQPFGNAVRSRDIVAYAGGEEFMVLLTSSSAEKRPSGPERNQAAGLRSENPAYVHESLSATNVGH